MAKVGHALDQVDGFTRAMLDRLRDTLSISTAEEFVSYSGEYRSYLLSILEVDPDKFETLLKACEELTGLTVASLEEEAAHFRNFSTGLDAPKMT